MRKWRVFCECGEYTKVERPNNFINDQGTYRSVKPCPNCKRHKIAIYRNYPR